MTKKKVLCVLLAVILLSGISISSFASDTSQQLRGKFYSK